MKKFRCKLLASVASVTVALFAQSQTAVAEDDANGGFLTLTGDNVEQMVIVGGRTPVLARELGSAVTIIGSETLEQLQTPIISDILRDVPGVAVSRSGVPGTLTAVRIRGAEANQTLVIIDGVEANDPAGEAAFSFANLLAADIERIEVLRGPQSAIFGSEAIGGVINIITKAGEPGFKVFAEAQGGSFGTRQIGGGISGGIKRLTGRVSVNYFENEGVNIALIGDEDDSFQNITVNGKFRAVPIDGITIDGNFRYFDGESDFDAFNGTPLPPNPIGVVTDAPNVSFENELLARLAVTHELFDGKFTQFAAFEFGDHDNESVSFFGDFESVFPSEAQRIKAKYQATGKFETGKVEHVVTGAFEFEEIDFSISGTDDSDDQFSFIGEYQFSFAERLFVTAGFRHDVNDLFEDATTFRVTVAAIFDEVDARLHGSYGTGIINPTFFELFGFSPNFVGNTALTPEKAESFDIGVEKRFLDDRLALDVTYFRGALTDEIIPGSIVFEGAPIPSVVNQLGESDRQGVEFSMVAQLTSNLTFRGAYTFTDAEEPDGSEEVRRAPNIASANFNYQFAEGRGNVNVGVDFNGNQRDFFFDEFFSTSLLELESFVLLNIAGRYKFDNGIEVFGRIENATDTEFQEVFGFAATGIGAFGGIRFEH